MKRLFITFLFVNSIIFLAHGMDLGAIKKASENVSDNGYTLKIPDDVLVEGFCSLVDVSWSAFERDAVAREWCDMVPAFSQPGVPALLKKFYEQYVPGFLYLTNNGDKSIYICREKLLNGFDAYDAIGKYPSTTGLSIFNSSNYQDLLAIIGAVNLICLRMSYTLRFLFGDGFSLSEVHENLLSLLLIGSIIFFGINEIMLIRRLILRVRGYHDASKDIRRSVYNTLCNLTKRHVELLPGMSFRLAVFVEREKMDQFKKIISSEELVFFNEDGACECKNEENCEVIIDIDAIENIPDYTDV